MQQEPEKIAVFDLNQTVYFKSSKESFFKFLCFKKNHKLIYVFQLAIFGALSKFRLINQTVFKENFFQYLNGMPPEQVKKYARQFWQVEWKENFNEDLLNRISELQQQGVKIIFITGTFDVYVSPLFEHFLKVDAWMATETYYQNGSYKIKGKALKGAEKVDKLNDFFGHKPYRLVETYSDKKEALFKIAEKAFIMKNRKAVPYHPQM